jgi:peptide methionine sulfoxide reductase MsrA
VDAVYENTTLRGYLETISSLSSEQSTAEKKYKAASSNKKKYEEALKTLQIKYDNALLLKEELYRLFYNRYSRFIQEGTWIDESYYDDSLYYNDALSVLYNSSMPKVNYDISVISLAGIPGYELFDFKIGD